MKPKSRKRKFILSLVAAVLVGSAAALVGARYVMQHRIEGWRKDGIAASQAGDHERAADLLGRFLQRRPGDIEALSFYIKSRELAELPNGQHLTDTVTALRML